MNIRKGGLRKNVKINTSCPLVLSNLFLYDFRECYWNILNRMGVDLSSIPKHDKLERNIAIGKLQSKIPNLAKYLHKTAQSMVTEFLKRNQVQEHEIIVRQRDGVILTRPLEIIELENSDIRFDKRKEIDFLIISLDRRKFLLKEFSSNKVVVKGIPHLYDSIRDYYQKYFSELNLVSKSQLCSQLHFIKESIKSQPKSFFCIPVNNSSNSAHNNKKERKYYIYLIGEGLVIVAGNVIDFISLSNIDIELYFNHYIRPFSESLFLELL